MGVLVSVISATILYLVWLGLPRAGLRPSRAEPGLIGILMAIRAEVVLPRRPSWLADDLVALAFLQAVVRVLRGAGHSELRILAALRDREIGSRILVIAAQMEAEGAPFVEQQFAAADCAAGLMAADRGRGATPA